MNKRIFLETPNGDIASLYTISNNKINAEISDFGGVIYSLNVPDKAGNLQNVVLAYKNNSDYLNNNPFLGTLVGRYANRIKNGKFTIDNIDYQLTKNSNGHSLHGGGEFNNVIWEVVEHKTNSLTLKYRAFDMEYGFPGNLNVEVKYTITDDNAIKIEYRATTDKRTIINLTNHSYFNLDNSDTIDEHLISLNADSYTVTDLELIPTGEIRDVKNTVYDLRNTQKFADLFNISDGYDDNFILNDGCKNLIEPSAIVYSPKSGIELSYFTTEVGVQLYTGNFLNNTIQLSSGKNAQKHSGFCLESQHFPDSPNHKNFPSTILNPGDVYLQTTIYKFKVK